MEARLEKIKKILRHFEIFFHNDNSLVRELRKDKVNRERVVSRNVVVLGSRSFGEDWWKSSVDPLNVIGDRKQFDSGRDRWVRPVLGHNYRVHLPVSDAAENGIEGSLQVRRAIVANDQDDQRGLHKRRQGFGGFF